MGQEAVCRDVWHGSPREALLKIGVDVFGAVGQTSQIGTPTLRQAFGVPGGAVSEQHGAFLSCRGWTSLPREVAGNGGLRLLC
jgi:hypothetical protein